MGKILLFSILLGMSTLCCKAQNSCFTEQLQKGNNEFNQGLYKQALESYKAGLMCSEVKENEKNKQILNQAIKSCEDKIQEIQEISQRKKRLQQYAYSEGNWSEGRLAVRLKNCNDNCKYGFIDANANLVIPCLFDSVANFSEGLSLVRMGENYGFIDKQGNMVIEPQYTFATSFKDGKATAFIKGNKYESILIDQRGNIIENLKFRPECLSLHSIYEYAMIKYNNEEHKKAFIALKAYEEKQNKSDLHNERDRQAIYLLGCYYYILGHNEGNDTNQESAYQLAINCWNKISTYNTNALYMLGECKFYGRGCLQNYNEAFICYQDAARKGNRYAQNRIGMYYFHGIGAIKQNYNYAIYWFKKASEEALSDAQVYLGRCYVMGKGIKENTEEGMKWYEKAAEQKNPKALFYLGNIYYYGLSNRGTNKAKGLTLWHKAAELGNADALIKIGDYYKTENNIQKAIEYWIRAAQQGYPKASGRLAEYYGDSTKSDADIEISKYWIQQKEHNEAIERKFPFAPIYDCHEGIAEF